MAGRSRIPPIEITADDKASPKIGKVADAVDDLDGRDAEVRVDADADAAVGDLAKVEGSVDELDGRRIDLNTGALEAALARVRGEADQTAKKLRDVDDSARAAGETSIPAGNSIADLAGPLGDAEGAASTAAGVFEGMTDLLAGLGPAAGLSAEALGKMTAALGAVGLAVAAGAAIWTKLQGDSKKAREEAEAAADAFREVQAALAEGDARRAAEAFSEAFAGVGDAARAAGVAVPDAVRFIIGAAGGLGTLDQAIAANAEQWAELQAQYEAGQPIDVALRERLDEQGDALAAARDKLVGLRDSYRDASGQSHATEEDLDGIAEGLGAVTTTAADAAEALDDMKNALDLKAEYLDAVDDADSLAGSLADLWAVSHDVEASTEDVADAQRAAAGDALALKSTIYDLVAQYGRIPDEEKTKILAELPKAQQAEFLAFIAEVERTHEASIDLDLTPAQRKLREFQLRMANAGIRPGGGGLVAVPGMAPAPMVAGGAPAVGEFGRGAAAAGGFPVYAAAGPTVMVTVNAGAGADPYRIGQVLAEHLDAWAAIGGRWRPGGRVA